MSNYKKVWLNDYYYTTDKQVIKLFRLNKLFNFLSPLIIVAIIFCIVISAIVIKFTAIYQYFLFIFADIFILISAIALLMSDKFDFDYWTKYTKTEEYKQQYKNYYGDEE